MLHAEVALVDHEVDQPLINRRRRLSQIGFGVDGFYIGCGSAVPHRFFCQFLTHDLAGNPFKATEDGAARVEFGHVIHLHPTCMIKRATACDG